MRKTYNRPQSTVYALVANSMMAQSFELKDEIGGDQLSNDRSGWDSPEWAEEEE